jgi:hypothetical protein
MADLLVLGGIWPSPYPDDSLAHTYERVSASFR